jgi:hypothetical protein
MASTGLLARQLEGTSATFSGFRRLIRRRARRLLGSPPFVVIGRRLVFGELLARP